ncbi:MAG: DUF393 domain-containing protein, partial [Pseudomonadota bacterium]
MIQDQEPYSYRDDPKVPSLPEGAHFTVMDAECSLCSKGATWIARNDTANQFKIIPLQSKLGNALMMHYGLDSKDPTSWLYLEKGRAFTSLDAYIRVGWQLGGVWKALSVLRLIPRSIQDVLYRWVATNRYRWFGKGDLCSLPD